MLTMFGISDSDLRPIVDLGARLDPDVDVKAIGSWGILFVCCGAMAGQSLGRKSALAESLRVPTWGDLADYERGKMDPEHYALLFSEYIKRWYADQAGANLAAKRLEAMVSSSEARQKMIHYFRLAIMLNSIAGLTEPTFVHIRDHAASDPFGWARLFFATGMILSSDQTFRWEQMAATLLGGSGALRQDLKALYARYSRLR